MADFYKRRDVQALLKYRKILFLGDSNVRSLYKDLINAIKHRELISMDTLKNPNVDSYCGDIAIQQCGKKNEWTFWENRLFEEGPWRVEMFCTGGVLIREIQQYICKLPESPSSMPDIVYISYNFSSGKNTQHLVCSLFVNVKMILPCNTLLLVGSSFPTTRDMFGDPRFDEVPFFSMGMLSRDNGTEDNMRAKVTSLGFHYLNISHYLRKNVFRGMTTKPGWESVIVRYTTFLLLTYIAKALMIKTPNRVNQDVLHKAMSSSNDEREIYNSLLLKTANDWLSVKTAALSEETDPATSNAHEITQMLWKVYHRIRAHSYRRRKSVSKRKSKRNLRRKKRYKGESAAPSPESSGSKICDDGKHSKIFSAEAASAFTYVSQKVTDTRRKTIELKENHTEEHGEYQANENVTTTHENIAIMDLQTENPSQDDEESLEEGEIRESPRRRPQWQGDVQIDSNVLSGISSSEGAGDTLIISPAGFERVVLPAVSTYHQYYQHHTSLIHGYQSYHAGNYQMVVPTYETVLPQEQIQFTDLNRIEPVVTIAVSDEEPTPEGSSNDECSFANEAIINLNSEESDTELSSHIETIEPLQALSYHEKSEIRPKNCGGNDKLCLVEEHGTLISWPNEKSREALWKWWRTHIEVNNGFLVLYHPSMGSVHGVIPSYLPSNRTCIAVPKIVDDMHELFKALAKTKFPEYCADLNVGSKKNDKYCNLNKKGVKPVKMPPLAEELTRGSIKKINFEIKKKPSCPASSNRITIKEFASIRNLNTKNPTKSNLDVSCDPTTSTSSTFYSYGENIKIIPKSHTPYGSPRGQLVTSSNTTSKKLEGKSIRTFSNDTAKDKPSKDKNVSKSTQYEKKQHSYKEKYTTRGRHRSSSSSDRSPPSD